MTLCKVVGLNLTEAVYYCCNWHTLVLNDLRVLLKLAVRHCNLIIDHEVVINKQIFICVDELYKNKFCIFFF